MTLLAHQVGLWPQTSQLAHWERVKKDHPVGAKLADQHYNRRKIGSPQWMPPGQTIVLLAPGSTPQLGALFGWWRPDPDCGIPSMNGLNGWTCTIFRRQGWPVLASTMILDAEQAMTVFGYDIGPDGLLTYVWDSKVESSNPGFCFKAAGWTVRGRSKDGRKTLLWKDARLAGVAPDSTATCDIRPDLGDCQP